MKKCPRTRTLWRSMIQRGTGQTQTTDYHDRGITVCKRWLDFDKFYEDMGPAPLHGTLERINNNKGYSPSNCCWASRSVQNRNKRNTVYVKLEGKRRKLIDVADEYGVPLHKLRYRLQKKKLSITAALKECGGRKQDTSDSPPSPSIEEQIYHKIKTEIEKRDPSLLRLADNVGMGYHRLYRFVNGEAPLPIDDACKLVQYLFEKELISNDTIHAL